MTIELDARCETVFSWQAFVFAGAAALAFVLALTVSLAHWPYVAVCSCALSGMGLVAACAAYTHAASARRARRLPAQTALMEANRMMTSDLAEAHCRLVDQSQRLHEMEARLESLTSLDSVTRLSNHGSFHERFREELRHSRLSRSPLSLLRVDIDGFKRYNETYGHAAGDFVLSELAETLSGIVRESDFVARYGGDEFVVLLPETDYLGALEAAERLRVAAESAPWQYQTITFAIGAATLSRDARRRSDLLAQADASLKYAKVIGAHQVMHAQDLPSRRVARTRDALTLSHDAAAERLAA